MSTIRIALFLCTLLLSACTAVTDPGRFSFDDEPTCLLQDESDLVVVLYNFTEFESEQLHILGVDGTNTLVFRGVVDELDTDGVSLYGSDNAFRLCLTVPELRERHADLSINVYADLNEDGVFQPTDGAGGILEPSWRATFFEGVAEVFGDETGTFDRPDAAPPGNFRITMDGMGTHVFGTQHLAAMLVEGETPVGYHRIHDVDMESFSLTIPTVLAPNTTYLLEFYADANENGIYDPEDHSWSREYTSDDTGNIDATFDHVGTFDPLTFF